MTRWILIAAALALLPALAHGQTVTLSGRVVEQGTGEAIPAATVQLDGRTVLTNGNGAFVFAGLTPGQRGLTVFSIGYSRLELALNLRRDTTLLIELTVEAVRVDSVTVRAGTFSVRGAITEAETGRPILDADIVTDAGRSTRTNTSGRYRIRGLRTGQALLIEARALGRTPVRVALDALRDTTINFALPRDPVAEQMMARHMKEIDKRLDALSYSTTTIGRDSLMSQYYDFTAHDIVSMRLRIRRRTPFCTFLDDRRLMADSDELKAYLPDQIHRIEIIDRGTMVRVYTRIFMQEMMRGRVHPRPIVLVRGLQPPICH